MFKWKSCVLFRLPPEAVLFRHATGNVIERPFRMGRSRHLLNYSDRSSCDKHSRAPELHFSLRSYVFCKMFVTRMPNGKRICPCLLLSAIYSVRNQDAGQHSLFGGPSIPISGPSSKASADRCKLPLAYAGHSSIALCVVPKTVKA